ncbi:MAG: DUF736 family protein [Pseudomonadota bacterium]
MENLTNYVSINGDKLTGNIASITFDVDFRGTAVVSDNEKAPKFRLTAKSPRGRDVEIGAIWEKTSQEGKEYFSFKVDTGSGPLYGNLGRYQGQDDDTLYAMIMSERTARL